MDREHLARLGGVTGYGALAMLALAGSVITVVGMPQGAGGSGVSGAATSTDTTPAATAATASHSAATTGTLNTTATGSTATKTVSAAYSATITTPSQSKSAATASTPTSDSSAATASASSPGPAEGHSPQLSHALSGPLSGTGIPGAGESAASSSTASASGTAQSGLSVRSNAAESTAQASADATSTAASSVLNGIDVASGQHPNGNASDINWADVANAGYTFAAVKASEGNYYTNPYYTADAKNATAAGMYVAPYAFANPYGSGEQSPPNGTAVQQADYAVTEAATAEGTPSYKATGKYLPILLDIEYDPYTSSEPNSNSCYGLSTSAMVTWLSNFAAEIKAKTGAEPLIYTTQDWWATCTGNSTSFGGDVLWVAAYASGTPGTLPAGWNTWNMWQYSDSGTVSGISGEVDLDYFGGVPETLQTDVNTAAAPVQVRTLSGLAGNSETYKATGLPPGTTMTSGGLISGTPTDPGSYDVSITPSGSGTVLPATLSFTWTVSGTFRVAPPRAPIPVTGSPAPLRPAPPAPLPSAISPAPPKVPADDR